jgi:hypothetical protein
MIAGALRSDPRFVHRDSSPVAGPGAIAAWSVLLVAVYGAFCWITRDRSLIPDEIWALSNAEFSWHIQLASIRADFVHPPLMYAIERLWIEAFGFSDPAVKMLPIAINVVAVALFPFLATRVTARWRLVSVLFLAFYLHVFSTPNLVRMYGLTVLLAIVALLCWDLWRSRPSDGALARWALAMSLVVLTHFYGMLLLAAFVLVGWWRGPRRVAFTLAAAVPALAFLAWLAYVFPVYAARGLKGNLSWIEPDLLRAMTVVPFHFLTMIPSGGNPIHPDWWAALPGMKYLVLGAILLNTLLFAFPFARRRTHAIDWHWLGPLTVLAFAPMGLLAGASLVVGPAFDTRFVLGSVPAYWLWVATLVDQGGPPAKVVLGAVVVPAVLLSVVLPLRHDLAVSPLREAAATVAREEAPGDILLADNQIGPQAYWELRRAGIELPTGFLPASRQYARFAPVLDAPARVWTFCRGACNETIQARLADHVLERTEGRYLSLYRRRP